MTWKGTVHCSWCYEKGHNRRGCKSRKKYIQQNPDSPDARQERRRETLWNQKRLCSYCAEDGHTVRTCPLKKRDIVEVKHCLHRNRAAIKKAMIESGLGIGSLVDITRRTWSVGSSLALVTDFGWLRMDADHIQVFVQFLDDSQTQVRNLSINRELLDEKIISKIDPDVIKKQMPEDWLTGDRFDELMYFPKGTRRSSWRINNISDLNC